MIQSHPALMPMLHQLRDNAVNEGLFKVRMLPSGDLSVNGGQTVCNENHFNEFRKPLAACCGSTVNYLDGMPLCEQCGDITDQY